MARGDALFRLAVRGLAVRGLAVPGLTVPGLAVLGLAVLGLTILGMIAASLPIAAAEPVVLAVTRHPLNPDAPAERRTGRLAHRGTIELRAEDPRFGGFSALHVDPAGRRFLALSDQGHWLRGTLVFDAAGQLAGADDAEIGALAGPDGRPLAGKAGSDAEAMAVLADGSVLVAFERRHRLWRYGAGPTPFSPPPVPFPAPRGLDLAPANGGIEALAVLGQGRIFALSEELETGEGTLAGWLWRDAAWQPLRYRRTGEYRPTGAAALPDGGMVVVERRFSIATGLGIRVALIRETALDGDAAIEPMELARLLPPEVIDNFEGIAASRAADGTTLLYLISDDNFSALQRTLLAVFALYD